MYKYDFYKYQTFFKTKTSINKRFLQTISEKYLKVLYTSDDGLRMKLVEKY